MQPHEYEVMAAVEDRHFWFIQTRLIVGDTIKAAGLGPESRILDVGCGTGGTMKALAGLAQWTGTDLNEYAVELARQRSNAQVFVAEAANLPFEDHTFDAVTALDVLVHIEDDLAALAEIRRVLKPGGTLITTVPCHPVLYSRHDRALGHVRRYQRADFLDKVQLGGFVVQRATWMNSLLFPLAAAARLADRLMARGGTDSDAATNLGPLNGVFNVIFGLERQMLKKTNMPIGLSLLVVSKSPG